MRGSVAKMRGSVAKMRVRMTSRRGSMAMKEWRVILNLFQDNTPRHFFRPKSTLTTLEPSSTTIEGPSLPASSCCSGAASPAST